MEIRSYHPGEYDEVLAAAMTEVLSAAWSVDCPHEPAVPMRSHLLRLRHGWDGDGAERVFHVYEGRRIVAHASVEVSHWEDNEDLAWFDITVLPEMRRRGYGRALLDTCTAFATSLGKTNLMAGTWKDSPADSFARAQGYADAQQEAQRRLDLVTLDQDRIDKLHEEALKHTAGYELTKVEGAAPEEMVPTLVEVTSAINDAPKDDLDFEDEVYTPERIRAFGAAQTAREQRVYRVLARSLEDGSWAGQSLVAVDSNRPLYADQLDTSVVVRHRGHRLGLLLKTEMLRWLRETEPQLVHLDTWNAASNTHMIAVNDLLGCQVVGNMLIWQRRLSSR